MVYWSDKFGVHDEIQSAETQARTNNTQSAIAYKKATVMHQTRVKSNENRPKTVQVILYLKAYEAKIVNFLPRNPS